MWGEVRWWLRSIKGFTLRVIFNPPFSDSHQTIHSLFNHIISNSDSSLNYCWGGSFEGREGLWFESNWRWQVVCGLVLCLAIGSGSPFEYWRGKYIELLKCLELHLKVFLIVSLFTCFGCLSIYNNGNITRQKRSLGARYQDHLLFLV
jgi:hypothetical protein